MDAADEVPEVLAVDGSDPNILFTISMPAAVVAQPQTTSSLMEEVAAPSQLASAGGSARQITPRTWNVPQHLALETFLYSSGPPEISRYNFNFVMRRIKDQFVRRQAYEAGGKHSPADAFVLTPAGEERHKTNPELNCFRLEMACSGASKHGKEAPNCRRVCGGIDLCAPGCKSSGDKHHACTVRLVITRSLDDVFNNRVHVLLKGALLSHPPEPPEPPAHQPAYANAIAGDHVPQGSVAVPPPLSGLATAPSVKASLGLAVVGGEKPTTAVNNAAAAMPEGSASNSRYVPPARVVARTAKSQRRAQRGGTKSDAMRVDLLIRAQLVQRQLVLLYRPGIILVLATPWSLERARVDGKDMLAYDCKVDTVAQVPSKWSSFRGRTPRDLSAPFGTSISPKEDNTTVCMGAIALADNVACSEANCDHAFFVDYGADGSIRMRRRCKRWFKPAVCIVRGTVQTQAIPTCPPAHAPSPTQ
jgi:hypothetical protein